MSNELRRSDPDVLLARLKAEEETAQGTLRIWLGAAPGAGKTYAMLREGHRRKSRGADVVIGFLETHGRPDIQEQIGDLETVAPREVLYNGTVRLEMATDAILARRPKVALVDDLAHTNLPGSNHGKRYEDIQELLDAGISVITTVNVGNIESLSGYAEQITGIEMKETVPDRILDEAQQVELIDLAPEVFIQRLKDGCIFPPEHAARALQTVYTPSTLTALRALALRTTAREVEEKLDTYFHDRKLEGLGIGERVMVAVDHSPSGKTLIRRGWRLAAALKGKFIVVHVVPVEDRRKPQSAAEEQQLTVNLQFAEDLGAEVVQLRGKVPAELIAYARTHHVSHLFIGHPNHSRWGEFFRGSVTNTVLRQAPGISVHVIGRVHAAPTKETASPTGSEAG